MVWSTPAFTARPLPCLASHWREPTGVTLAPDGWLGRIDKLSAATFRSKRFSANVKAKPNVLVFSDDTQAFQERILWQPATTPPMTLKSKMRRSFSRPSGKGLLEEYGRTALRFPKELILLGGAPGAGKGTHTKFVMQARGLTCQPIIISDLLTTPESKKIKDQGGMVGDKEVVAILLRKLLEEQFRDGAILDGFPRTRVQVECLKLLVDNINNLHREFEDSEYAIYFRQPTIHAMVLFVTEKTSIERQLKRGREILQLNRAVEETGVGTLRKIRANRPATRDGPTPLSRLQRKNLGCPQVTERDLSLPFRQCRRPDRRGRGQYSARTAVSKLARTPLADFRSPETLAIGRRHRPSRPSTAGQSPGLLRIGTYGFIHPRGEYHSKQIHAHRAASRPVGTSPGQYGRRPVS